MTSSSSSQSGGYSSLWRAVLAWLAVSFAVQVSRSPTLAEPLPPRPRPAQRKPAASADKPAAGADNAKEVVEKANWTQIVKQLLDRFTNDRVMAVAAGCTFYALLALFPAIAALVSLYALVADPSTIQQQLEGLSNVMPGGAVEIVGDQVKRIASKGGGTLGVSFVIGLAVSLWSANAGVKAMFDALNIVYEEKEERSFIKLNLVTLAFTLGLLLFLIGAVVAVVGVPVMLNYVGLGPVAGWIAWIGRWPALLAAVVLVLAALYRWGPDRPDAHWRWLTPGSAIAAVLWLVASAGFSYYAANFGSYNETYGTLGAAIGMMTWMWISIMIVLVGGEINAQLEGQSGHAGPQ